MDEIEARQGQPYEWLLHSWRVSGDSRSPTWARLEQRVRGDHDEDLRDGVTTSRHCLLLLEQTGNGPLAIGTTVADPRRWDAVACPDVHEESLLSRSPPSPRVAPSRLTDGPGGVISHMTAVHLTTFGCGRGATRCVDLARALSPAGARLGRRFAPPATAVISHLTDGACSSIWDP